MWAHLLCLMAREPCDTSTSLVMLSESTASIFRIYLKVHVCEHSRPFLLTAVAYDVNLWMHDVRCCKSSQNRNKSYNIWREVINLLFSETSIKCYWQMNQVLFMNHDGAWNSLAKNLEMGQLLSLHVFISLIIWDTNKFFIRLCL